MSFLTTSFPLLFNFLDKSFTFMDPLIFTDFFASTTASSFSCPSLTGVFCFEVWLVLFWTFFGETGCEGLSIFKVELESFEFLIN